MPAPTAPPTIGSTCHQTLPLWSSGVGRKLRAGPVAIGIVALTLGNAVAQPAAPEGQPKLKVKSEEPPMPDKLQPWKWQLAAGIPLLAVGIILSGVGGAYLADPPVTDPMGCNIMGLAGPCVLARSTTGPLLGFGLAFGIGGAVLTGIGIHSALQARTPSPVSGPTDGPPSNPPTSVPVSSP